MMTADPDRLGSIQVLRGLAAMAVVLFHLGLLTIGYAGVDVFFVVSGFVMGTIGRRESPGIFLLRRLIRIAPLYWIVLFTVCGLSMIPGLTTTIIFDTASLLKSLAFIPYVDRSGQIAPVLVVGWTLNYEMIFYLVFAAGLLAGAPLAVASCMLLAMVVTGAVFPQQGAIWFTWTNPLLLEFLAGLLLATAPAINGRRVGLILLIAGVGGFALACATDVRESQTLTRVALLGLPAALLVSGAVALDRAAAWPRLTALETLGDASYALYLWHGLVVSAMIRILPSPMTLPSRLFTVVASIAFALLIYRCLERPMTDALRRSLGVASHRRDRNLSPRQGDLSPREKR